MSEWRPRRFWKTATVVTLPEGGFAVHLDERPVRTPAKAALCLPSADLAAWIAREWDAQGELVDPATMPATRMANSAVDKVAAAPAEVMGELAGYGESDLICYRAESPAELVDRQAAAWDPLVDWARDTFGASLAVGTGVMHIPQPAASTRALADEVAKMTPWQLAAFHDLVALSGSLVIALATIQGFAAPDDLWQRSRIDEEWQAELWGKDDEAELVAENKRRSFLHAAAFGALLWP
ncbi:MAG: ATP12 family protein [Pseudomonadota bacterium]